jgi:hypothetical protein
MELVHIARSGVNCCLGITLYIANHVILYIPDRHYIIILLLLRQLVRGRAHMYVLNLCIFMVIGWRLHCVHSGTSAVIRTFWCQYR